MPALILLSLLALSYSPQAMPPTDHPAVTCPATPVSPPVGLKGWARKQLIRAGSTAKTATALQIGSGVTATLLPTPQVTYAVSPQKPGQLGSSGGMFAFTAPTAGRYRVALGAAAWIDVVTGTTSVASVAHAHGPDCTGLRKIVDFDLGPGRYLLQIVGNTTATLPLIVVRSPT